MCSPGCRRKHGSDYYFDENMQPQDALNILWEVHFTLVPAFSHLRKSCEAASLI